MSARSSAPFQAYIFVTSCDLEAEPCLTEHEDQCRRLHSELSLMLTCVEECLRYVSPVQMTKPRFATRNMVCRNGNSAADYAVSSPASFKPCS